MTRDDLTIIADDLQRRILRGRTLRDELRNEIEALIARMNAEIEELERRRVEIADQLLAMRPN